jgi:hypothetical protein
MPIRTLYCGLLIAGSFSLAGHVADAQGVRASQQLPGYTCMSLALDPGQIRSFASLPPIKDAPRDDARTIGVASSVVFARTSERLVNGWTEVIMPNRKRGWVNAGYLRPYHSASNPSARCVPSIMSNGSIGISG